MRLIPLLLVLLLATLGYSYRASLWQIINDHLPPDYNPWATLDLNATPNILTTFKLNRLKNDPLTCRAVLDAAQVVYTPMNDQPNGPCPLTGTIRVPASGTSTADDPARVTFNNSFIATCPVVAAWELFRRHQLPALAHIHLGSPVVEVEHLGSYACRNIYGRSNASGARRSEHATANALDLRAFITDNGQRIVLANDWSASPTTPAARFLQATRDDLCRSFNTVLGPSYNAAHADHFHLDMGRFRVCR